MDKIIVYVDDAAFARQQLAPMKASAPESGRLPTHWVVVACAPRMTHRISKWVSHSARENWRAKWFAKTQEQIVPLLSLAGSQVTPVLAKGPLNELTRELKLRHGAACEVVDARRPKVGVELEPLSAAKAAQPRPATGGGWKGALSSVGGMGALFMLALQFGE